ncbi:MAG: vitamin K epoxide reductase family protein, partial [Microcystaceae cyanobacterium]
MSRRRSLPWIYRWSRPLIGAIAIIGAIITGYLTVVKLTGQSVACNTGVEGAIEAITGCDRVLNSAYATVFG